MPHPNSPLSTAAAAAAAAAALVLRHEFKGRQTAERIAAASLESLLKAIDANDPDTGAHVRRVATYALILADAAGLAEHELRSIERVALFHDIGKIHEALFDIIHESHVLSPAERTAIPRTRAAAPTCSRRSRASIPTCPTACSRTTSAGTAPAIRAA